MSNMTIVKDDNGRHHWQVRGGYVRGKGKLLGESSKGFRTRYLAASNAAELSRAIPESGLKVINRVLRRSGSSS